MKIAVLSDIHGNYVAFQKCVEHALQRGINTFIFLGDYIGELAYPQRTMDLLYVLRYHCTCYFIRGNKEEYWINCRTNGGSGWKDRDSTTGALLYAYENLTDEDIDFFERLPYSKELRFENLPPLTVCHGSPNNAREKMLPNSEKTYEVMDSDRNDLILCGHTHKQGKIEYHGRTVLNAGSVGISLNSDGHSQYMILEGENGQWSYEFISLEYDVERVIADLYESGLSIKAPWWCKVTERALRRGDVSHASVLAKAMTLCQQQVGECKWPNVPEKYWEQAVAEMVC